MNLIASPDAMRKTSDMYENINLDANDARIFIVGSVGGGTGSGIFLDIAYLVRNLIPLTHNFEISGVIVLPSAFRAAAIRGEYVRANSYAALKELEYYTRNDTIFKSLNSDDQGKPFKYIYLLSGTTERGISMDIDEVTSIAGEVICSNISLNRTGNLQGQLVTIDGDLDKQIDGKMTAYGSFGYASIVLPIEDIKGYCVNRLGKEIVYKLINDPDQNKISTELNSFVTGVLEPASLKTKIVIEEIEKPTYISVSKTLMDDVENWKNSVDTKKIKEEAKKICEIRIDETKDVLIKAVERLTNTYNPKFSDRFLDELDSSIQGYIREISRDIEKVRELQANTEESEGQIKNELEMLIHKMGKTRAKERSRDDYLENLTTQFNHTLEIFRLEDLIVGFYNCVRDMIKAKEKDKKGIQDDIKGIITNLEYVANDFMTNENTYKGAIRRRGKFFEKKLSPHDEELDEMFGSVNIVTERDRLTSASRPYSWKDFDEKELFNFIHDHCKGAYGSLSLSVADFLIKNGSLQEEIGDLYSRAVVLWTLGPGTEVPARDEISILSIQADKKGEVAPMPNTEVIGITNKREITLAQFKYAVPLRGLSEVKICKGFYKVQSEDRNLHTDYSIDFPDIMDEDESPTSNQQQE